MRGGGMLPEISRRHTSSATIKPVACSKFNVTPNVNTVHVQILIGKVPIIERVVTSLLGQES